jgi:hypothetical protein
VHTFAYKLKLRPLVWSPAALTPEALAGRLASDASIRSLSEESWGHVADIALERDSHQEALNELLTAAQELGYSFAEAEITKVADRALEMAFGGGITGAGVVGSSSQNGEAAFLGGLAGWAVGLLIGAGMEKVEVIYEVQWTNAGWHLISVPRTSTAARPRLEAA